MDNTDISIGDTIRIKDGNFKNRTAVVTEVYEDSHGVVVSWNNLDGHPWRNSARLGSIELVEKAKPKEPKEKKKR